MPTTIQNKKLHQLLLPFRLIRRQKQKKYEAAYTGTAKAEARKQERNSVQEMFWLKHTLKQQTSAPSSATVHTMSFYLLEVVWLSLSVPLAFTFIATLTTVGTRTRQRRNHNENEIQYIYIYVTTEKRANLFAKRKARAIRFWLSPSRQ